MLRILLLCIIAVAALLSFAVATESTTAPLPGLENVRIVANGTNFDTDGQYLIITEPNGTVTRELLYSTSTSQNQQKRGFPVNGLLTALQCNGNFSYFQAYWTVPPVPMLNWGQVLFYYNALLNAAGNILQPALQYNNAPAGWSVSSWYSVGASYYQTTPITVYPGDTITGIVALSGSLWYVEVFVNNYLTSLITVSASSIGNSFFAQWSSSAFGLNSCGGLPPSNTLSASSIYLGVGTSWTRVYFPLWFTPVYNVACSAVSTAGLLGDTAQTVWVSTP